MNPAPSSVHLFPLQSLRDPARLVWLSSHPFYRCRSWGTECLNTWHKLCRTGGFAGSGGQQGGPDRSPCSPGREEGRRPRESLLTQARSVPSHYRQMYHAFFRVAWGLANCERTSSPCLLSGSPGRRAQVCQVAARHLRNQVLFIKNSISWSGTPGLGSQEVSSFSTAHEVPFEQGLWGFFWWVFWFVCFFPKF